jgi:hypothetical protein
MVAAQRHIDNLIARSNDLLQNAIAVFEHCRTLDSDEPLPAYLKNCEAAHGLTGLWKLSDLI